jgi:hypothetical protein
MRARRLLRAFAAKLRGLGRDQRHADEFEAEVREHLQLLEERFTVQGMSKAEARVAARRQFGNTTLLRENRRALQTLPRLDGVLQDIRFAVRLMTRHAWGSATILAVLTVGMAMNVSMFTIVNAVLLRPWVKSDPETFLALVPQYSGKYPLRFSDYGSMSLQDYRRYRDSARSLESLAAYRTVTLTLHGDEAGSVRSALVSCDIFDVLRPGRPLLGRYLTSAECSTPMEPAVAVLSESAWRGRFAADPSIVGRVIQLNRQPFTVIGVAPVMELLITGPANPPARRLLQRSECPLAGRHRPSSSCVLAGAGPTRTDAAGAGRRRAGAWQDDLAQRHGRLGGSGSRVAAAGAHHDGGDARLDGSAASAHVRERHHVAAVAVVGARA